MRPTTLFPTAFIFSLLIQAKLAEERKDRDSTISAIMFSESPEDSRGIQHNPTCIEMNQKRFNKVRFNRPNSQKDRLENNHQTRGLRPISEIEREFREYHRDLAACYEPQTTFFAPKYIKDLSIYLAIKEGILRCLKELNGPCYASDDGEKLRKSMRQTVLLDLKTMDAAARSDCAIHSKYEITCVHFSRNEFQLVLRKIKYDVDRMKRFLLAIEKNFQSFEDLLEKFKSSRTALRSLSEVDTSQIMSESLASSVSKTLEEVAQELNEIQGLMKERNLAVEV